MKLVVLIGGLLFAGWVDAQPVDGRFCGPPVRDASGVIVRSARERGRFVVMHPCPATGQVSGACPGWQVDHVIPLACGGCDSTMNMQWLPVQIKTCAAPFPCKDRWERRVYETSVVCK